MCTGEVCTSAEKDRYEKSVISLDIISILVRFSSNNCFLVGDYGINYPFELCA